MKTHRIIGASLIVAGTSIGAAMLALPLASAKAGFLLSLIILIVSWFFMYSTALCIVEVESTFDDPSTSFISMAEKTLGRWGSRLTAISFFCLLYSLLAAYITGGGDIIQNILIRYWPGIPYLTGLLLWTASFAVIIYLGILLSDQVNRLLMLVLFIAYAILSYYLSQHIDNKNLLNGDTHYVLAAIPVVFTTHAYHIVIPSIYHYLDHNVRSVKKALFLGSLLPLLLYIIWEYIVFGALNHGDQLTVMSSSNHATSDLIAAFTHLSGDQSIDLIAKIFVFFAIATSFLGVSLGLFDLIKDGLARVNQSRTVQLVLTFLPSLLFAILFPGGFMIALNYAGLFVAILHGVLPVFMVLAKRYRLNQNSLYTLSGGLGLQIFLLLFYLFVIAIDVGINLT